jgi:hypothetical protein
MNPVPFDSQRFSMDELSGKVNDREVICHVSAGGYNVIGIDGRLWFV